MSLRFVSCVFFYSLGLQFVTLVTVLLRVLVFCGGHVGQDTLICLCVCLWFSLAVTWFVGFCIYLAYFGSRGGGVSFLY